MSQDRELKIWAALDRIQLASRDLEQARDVLARLEEYSVGTSSALDHLTQALGAAQLAADDLRPLLDTTVEEAP